VKPDSSSDERGLYGGPLTSIEADPSVTVEEFLKEARERYTLARNADDEDRKDAEDDNNFSSGTIEGQWSAEALAVRKDPVCPRPALVWDHIVPSLQQVGNESRQANPAIKIDVMDGGVKATADYFQGRIRQIEYDSSAENAYDTSAEQQLSTGRAFTRVTTEYIPGTFQQRAVIEPIEDQFAVAIDPAARKQLRSDADYSFVIEWISKQEHERRFGKNSVVSSVNFASGTSPAVGWIGVGPRAEMIQIAEYCRKHYRLRTLCELEPPGGGTRLPVWKEQLTQETRKYVVEERQEQYSEVWIYVINGAEVLKATRWLGSNINIVPTWGRMTTKHGKRRTESLIRRAKDPQRVINVTTSNIIELANQIPKTPYMIPVGGVPANLEGVYQNVVNTPYAFLLYNMYNATGKPLNKPERIIQEPPIQALLEILARAIDGVKAAMGIFDASLGNRSNETSGIAIDRRRSQSNIVNYHFVDNQNKSRKVIGEILLEILPQIDKPGKSYPVRDESGKTAMVPVGVPITDPTTGQTFTHILSEGGYGVSVSSGPSYASGRKEERDTLTAIITAVPEVFAVLGPRWMSLSDTANAQEDAELLKRWGATKFPGVFQDQGEGQIPPQVQQQVQQLQSDLQAALQLVQAAHREMQSKQAQYDHEVLLKKMDLDFDREELEANIGLGEAKLGFQAAIAQLQQEVAAIKHERALTAAQDQQQSDQEHEMAMAAQQQAAVAQGAPQGGPSATPQPGPPPTGVQTPTAGPQPTAAPTPQGV